MSPAIPPYFLASLLLLPLLSGCTLDGGNPGVRVLVLVLLPMALLAWLLWRLVQGGEGRRPGRPDLPEQDDQE